MSKENPIVSDGKPEVKVTADGTSSPAAGNKRIKVETMIAHQAPDSWFTPGNGRNEWFKDTDFGPEMVVVPAGEFMMGSSDNNEEMPIHKVTFSAPFAVGRFAITIDQWNAAHADGGVEHKLVSASGTGRHPVNHVSWEDAQCYCAWLSSATSKPYRLPSEAEWEYCCRAGSTTSYWWGSEISHNDANFNGGWIPIESSLVPETVPVDSYKSNPWGLYQVHGNVNEWVQDRWHDSYKGDPPKDGSVWIGGDPEVRVLRGGGCGSDPDRLRSSERGGTLPNTRNLGIGFRVARAI